MSLPITGAHRNGTADRFLPRRVLAQAWAMARTRWRPLVMAALTLGVALSFSLDLALSELAPGSDLLAEASQGLAKLQQAGPRAMLAPGVRYLARALTTAVLLAILLAPAGPVRLAGTLRIALLAAPATFVAQALQAAPMLAPVWMVMPMLTEPSNGVQPMAALAFFLVCGLLVLVILVLIGLTPAAAVAERRGPVSAMRRALALTRGRRTLLFGLLCAAGLALLVVAGLVSLVSAGGTMLQDAPWPLPELLSETVQTLGVVIKVTVGAAVFLELRRLVDPPTAQEAAEMFA